MIIQELVEINNRTLLHTFSSDSKYILQIETGVIYDEAYDAPNRGFHYTETDTFIPAEIKNLMRN